MNVRVLVTSLACVLCAGTFVACKSQTKLGAPCTLEKPNPDGGKPFPVSLDDIASISNQDLISFGSIECDADACVVDASNLESARAAAKASATGAITGYCSQSCIANGDDTKQCSPQYEDLQKKSDNVMHCRQLLLDQATLSAICTTDERCEAYFGSPKDKVTPDFCSRGTAVDAGT